MVDILVHYVVPVIHVVACFFLIVVVLLQTGKGADMGAVFGGGSQTLFGSSGAGNFLTKLTTATAITFMATSLFLTYGGRRSPNQGLFEKLPAAEEAAPEPNAAAGDATGDEALPPAAEVPATPPAPDAAAVPPDPTPALPATPPVEAK